MGYLATESVNSIPEWGKSQKAGGNYGTTTILSEHALEISADSNSIPVIDVSNIFSPDLEARKAVAAEIRQACINIGFFYVQNHGIPQELVDEVFEWGKKFFDLTFEEKMEVYIDNTPHYRGYTPLYGAGTAGSDGKGNANEAFDWGHDCRLNDDPEDMFIDPYMRGENPWPKQLPGFEAHLSEYYRTMRAFCRVMARNVALSLDLQESHFDSILTHPGCSALVAHYPPQEPKSGNLGLSAHTDAEFFTILAAGEVRALEVMRRDGYWISAPPKKGCFIVNVGDQLQAWSNDLYVSTLHRVLNYSGQERYSVPFFFSANYETVIEMYKETMIGFHKIADTIPELVKYRK
ncbi:putative 2-oxoglutarate-dependent dioxygenase [Lachnellula occidentalis]|uniref:Putative 2-oxoglutarate-dependent dioxygenase n=1 Tax=Lachnellula occidentalis TaxID=215460 RepID=A0A8H8RG30_9HELO|nr:putative 2-oxoglutarate-dependent dioxygenase [Lachnellula occidentalis]